MLVIMERSDVFDHATSLQLVSTFFSRWYQKVRQIVSCWCLLCDTDSAEPKPKVCETNHTPRASVLNLVSQQCETRFSFFLGGATVMAILFVISLRHFATLFSVGGRVTEAWKSFFSLSISLEGVLLCMKLFTVHNWPINGLGSHSWTFAVFLIPRLHHASSTVYREWCVPWKRYGEQNDSDPFTGKTDQFKSDFLAIRNEATSRAMN